MHYTAVPAVSACIFCCTASESLSSLHCVENRSSFFFTSSTALPYITGDHELVSSTTSSNKAGARLGGLHHTTQAPAVFDRIVPKPPLAALRLLRGRGVRRVLQVTPLPRLPGIGTGLSLRSSQCHWLWRMVGVWSQGNSQLEGQCSDLVWRLK